ncbi:hypothetical protein TELCIR_13325 [Teladorsagia circumcincta]|uniref:Uncharacterized protein n=1 Tax=Teladorsagia circumcincta TaxID=45464 RepID=A0A2G9U459_TELCI|nr:hypothetical protein TELCIR_13325 [Teladorsagia circumcincta]
MRMDSMDNETVADPKSERSPVDRDVQKSCLNEDDCADFAFLPSIFLPTVAEEPTPKSSRKTPGKGRLMFNMYVA